MAVPTLITDLSTTPASNSPAGSENVFPNLDDYLRAQSAFLASVRDNSGNGWVSPYLPLAGGTMTGTVNGLQMASANGGQLAGLRNRLINGQTIIQQRGQISVTSAYQYSADRWLVALSGATVISSTSNVGGLSGSPSGYGLYITGTWTTGSPTWAQKIEAANVADLVNKQVTVSGYINFPSGVNDTISVSLFYANARDNFATSTLIATNTTPTITGGSTVSFSTTFSAATMNVANIVNGLQVVISKTNTVTHGTTANYVLACAQLEVSPVATPFEQRPYGMELALCQRYFQSYGGTTSVAWATPQISGSTGSSAYISHSPTFRAAPSLTVVGTGFTAQDNSAGPATATITLGTGSTAGSSLNYSHTSLTQNATRTLIFSNNSSYLQFSAEL